MDLKIFNNDECTVGFRDDRSLKDGIVESQLCAGDSTGEKDTCQVIWLLFVRRNFHTQIFFMFSSVQGDSGGPIQVSTKNKKQNVFHVVGVTSFGKACATSLPGVYTRVSHYLDWIESIVWSWFAAI